MGDMLIKMLVLSLCLNTFVYLGTSYAMVQDDDRSPMPNNLFSLMLDNPDQFEIDLNASLNGANGTYGGGFSPNSNFTTVPARNTGYDTAPSSGGTSFFDALKIVYDFILIMGTILIAPFYLFFSGTLSPLVALIVGLPLVLINITTIIMFIRSG